MASNTQRAEIYSWYCKNKFTSCSANSKRGNNIKKVLWHNKMQAVGIAEGEYAKIMKYTKIRFLKNRKQKSTLPGSGQQLAPLPPTTPQNPELCTLHLPTIQLPAIQLPPIHLPVIQLPPIQIPHLQLAPLNQPTTPDDLTLLQIFENTVLGR